MKSKNKFMFRFILFLMFSLIVPISYFLVRYKLWKVQKTISIWGLFIIAIFCVVIGVLVKYYLDGMKTRYSYLKQVLNGFIKVVLPMSFILVVSLVVKNNIQQIVANINNFTIDLSLLLGTETIAILVNPLPKWAFENNVQGLVEIADKVIRKE